MRAVKFDTSGSEEGRVRAERESVSSSVLRQLPGGKCSSWIVLKMEMVQWKANTLALQIKQSLDIKI